jgi:uncharacterized protein YndB with AHSA1/START domain
VFAIHFANEKRERVSPPAHSGLGDAWDGEIVSRVTFTAEGRRTRVVIVNERSGVTAEWAEKARYGWGESLDKLAYAIADDMTVTPAGDREIVITRTFNAPRAHVYEAMTKAEHVKNWWGWRYYGPVSATADFRAGGHYRFAQRDGSGVEVAFSGEVRESSPERIVYIEEFEAMPGHGALTTVTLDERDGKTFVTVRSVYQSREDRDAIASEMEWGARLSYLQLDEVLAGM